MEVCVARLLGSERGAGWLREAPGAATQGAEACLWPGSDSHSLEDAWQGSGFSVEKED